MPGEPGAELPRPVRRRFAVRTAALMRWLHIYVSMFGLAAVLFFSVTGLTLNHPDWFGEPRAPRIGPRPDRRRSGCPLACRSARRRRRRDEPQQVAKLEIVEYLRNAHGIRGAVAEFQVDERECTVTFKGPGYAADAFIDRETGHYDLTQTIHGFVAVINDLHNGRDTGKAWSAVIDVSAIGLAVISLTGLVLLFYLKRKRVSGPLVVVGGAVAVGAVVMFFAP